MSFGRDDSFGFLSNDKEDEKCNFENNTSIMNIPFEKYQGDLTFSKNLDEFDDNFFAEDKPVKLSLRIKQENVFTNNILNINTNTNNTNLFDLNPDINTNAKINSNKLNNKNHNDFNNLATSLNNININKPYEIIELRRTLILRKLKNSIESICRIMLKNILITKYNAYTKLRRFLYTRKINYAKAELIFSNFQNLLKNLINIKANFNRKRLIKHLSYWRIVTQFNSNLQLLKAEIKQSFTGKYRKKIEESEKTKVLKQNEIAKIKSEIAKNAEIEANLNKKVKEFEDKEYLILQSIQKLENEKKLIEEEMLIFSNEKEIFNSYRKENECNGFRSSSSNFSNNNEKDKEWEFSVSPDKAWNLNADFSSNFFNNNTNNKGRSGSHANFLGSNNENNLNCNNHNNNNNMNLKGKKEILLGLEKKIIEYERKINKLTEANLTKDSQISSYMKEMNDIISKHEKTLNSFSSFNTADISKDDIADKNTKIYSAKTSLRGSNSYLSNNFSTFNTMKNNIVYKNNTNNNSALSSNLMINPNSILVNNNFSIQPNSVRNSVIKNNPYRLSNFPSFAYNKNKSLSNNFNSNNALSNSHVFNFAGSFGNNFNTNLNPNANANLNSGSFNYINNHNNNNNNNNSNFKGSYTLVGNENTNSFSLINEEKKYINANLLKNKSANNSANAVKSFNFNLAENPNSHGLSSSLLKK